MNKLFITLILLIFINHCSFNPKSKIWKNNEKEFENALNEKKIFTEEKKTTSEFNKGLKLDLSKVKSKNKFIDNKNNFGSQIYKGKLNKIGNFKFSKFSDISQLNLTPIFLPEGIIFFNKKGTIIRYNKDQKIIWKKNYYTKTEKKLQPKLNFALDKKDLLVADNIAKYYSINLDSGELNWLKNSIYPFNSDIKKYNDKIFVVDYKNTLKCYKIEDGSECWSLQTEDSFTISNSKYSLIIINDNIIFTNSIGDITSVNCDTGLITWQLATQNSEIINETYNFKISKLVSDGKSIYFSNNKNEFYSIDAATGTVNWINDINSNISPIIIENLILTVSNEGYLYVLEKVSGNIIRTNDLFVNLKEKKRKNIIPVGFVIGNTNLYLTSSDGKLTVVSLDLGNITKVEKVSGGLVSEPFIFNDNLFVLRNGSILQYD